MKASLVSKQKIAAVVAVFAVAVSPAVASAVSDTANTTINATVNPVISISSSTTVAVSLTPTAGGVVSSNSDTVTVSTNKNNGYNLTLANSDANTYLDSGTDTITAHTGTFASPTALGANTWGYAVAGAGGFSGSYSAETDNASSSTIWAGVPASGSPQVLKTTGAKATNDTTTVWYGVKANTSIDTGVYSDTVTYTATTN